MSMTLAIMRVAPAGGATDNELSVVLNMAQASHLPNCTGDDISLLPVQSLKVFDGMEFPHSIRLGDGSVEFWRAYSDAECAKYFDYYIQRMNSKPDGLYHYGFFVRSDYRYRLDMCQHGASRHAPDTLVLMRWYRNVEDTPNDGEFTTTLMARPIPDNVRRYPYGHCGRYKLHIDKTLLEWHPPFVMRQYRKGVRNEIMRRLEQFSQTGYELVLTNSDIDKKIFMALEPFLDPTLRSQHIWDNFMADDTILILDW